MSSTWCTIESDPGVFSELISTMGVEGVAVEEIFTLDGGMETQTSTGEQYGLILLFKWVPGEGDGRPMATDANSEDIFFAKQVVQNACATQAILSVLLNAEGINLGENLNELKNFAGLLDPESRGITIGNSEAIRVAHNSFARPEPFVQDDDDDNKSRKGKSEDVFHFVAYVPFRGSVYELDGLKPGPIKLGDVGPGENWWVQARPAIDQRMERLGQDSHFALLTVGEKRITVLEREIEECNVQLASMDLEDPSLITARLESLHAELAEEGAKLERQRQENIRRRHNFVPFIVTLLRALAAKEGAIDGCLTAARERRSAQLAAGVAKKL